MNIAEFESGLDRYGGDLKRWPAALQAGAEALVAENRTAAALARVARRLDSTLADAVAPLALDTALVGGIVAGVGRNGRVARDEVRPTRRLVAWAGVAMVAFLVTGYAIGLALPATTTQSDDATASLLFGDSGSSTTSGALGGLL